jgi:hypothetical protein
MSLSIDVNLERIFSPIKFAKFFSLETVLKEHVK